MELLGNENNAEIILGEVAVVNRHLLSSDIISDEDTQSLLVILSTLASTTNKDVLYNAEVSSMIFLLSDNSSALATPILRNLATEVKLRMLRLQCLDILPGNDLNINKSIGSGKKCCDNVDSKENPERFLPTPDNNFILPPEGEVTNLTVTEPRPDLGKNLIRDLIIDHNGYVIEERGRRYEDIYTDESEVMYNNAHIAELKRVAEENKAKEKSTGSDDTIKDAEDNCN